MLHADPSAAVAQISVDRRCLRGQLQLRCGQRLDSLGETLLGLMMVSAKISKFEIIKKFFKSKGGSNRFEK